MHGPEIQRRHGLSRVATIVVAVLGWLLIATVTITAPASATTGSVSDASSSAIASFSFGERASGGSDQLAAPSALRLSYGSSMGMRAGLLPDPDVQIWPDDGELQVVNLETFLHVKNQRIETRTNFFGSRTAYPLYSEWTFVEGETGDRSVERCLFTLPWLPGQTNALCGKDWDHSSTVIGEVEMSMRIQYLVVHETWFGTIVYPQAGPRSDEVDLEVSEVLSFGRSKEAPVEEDGGFCSVPIIGSASCWVGRKAEEFFVNEILGRLPWLRHVIDFFEGCGDAVLEAIGGIGELLKSAGELITNPGEFLGEQWEMIKDLYEAATTDPVEFAKAIGEDILKLDYLDDEGWAQWAGNMVCTIAIEYLTGKAAATLALKVRRFLRGDPPIPSSCRLSSFAPGTQVLMADGTHRPIELVRPGDDVVSYNVVTESWEPKRVVDQWSHPDRGPPATITLTNGATVTATDDHLFFTPASTGWVEAAALATGTVLLSTHATAEVESVSIGQATEWTVWELTVEDNHNFVVRFGSTDALVHNGIRSCHADGDDVRVVRDDGSEVIYNSDGTADFVDADGVRHTNVQVDASGNPMLDSDGNFIPGKTNRINDDWGVDEQWLDMSTDPPTPRYPDNNGRLGDAVEADLPDGVVFDRYGPTPRGGYISPEGTPFGDRSIPNTHPDGLNRYTYTQKPDTPPLPVQQAEIAPWFDQPGGGTQYELDADLVRQRYGPDGTNPHPDYDDMVVQVGDRTFVNTEYWFDIEQVPGP